VAIINFTSNLFTIELRRIKYVKELSGVVRVTCCAYMFIVPKFYFCLFTTMSSYATDIALFLPSFIVFQLVIRQDNALCCVVRHIGVPVYKPSC